MKIILVSCGFELLHSRHLTYFNSARDLEEKLILAPNIDEWLNKIRRKYSMTCAKKKAVIERLKFCEGN